MNHKEKARKLINSRNSLDRISRVLSKKVEENFGSFLGITLKLLNKDQEVKRVIADTWYSVAQPITEYLEELYCQNFSEEELDGLCSVAELPESFLSLEQTILRKAAVRALDLMTIRFRNLTSR